MSPAVIHGKRPQRVPVVDGDPPLDEVNEADARGVRTP